MPSDNIKVEPLEQQDNPIELQEYLITLLDKKQPLQEKINLLNHEIEKTKLQIKISYARYFQNKNLTSE